VILALLVFTLGGLAGWRQLQFRDSLNQARFASLDGRLAAAIAALRECESVDSLDRDVMLLSARVFRMQRAWPAADAVLEQYWTRYGDDPALTTERLLLRAARDDAEAVAPVLAARIAQGGDEARLCRQALVSGYIREFRYADAKAILDDWRATAPNDPLAGMLTGQMAEQLYNTQGAEDAYAAVVARHPDHHEARLRLVDLLMQQRSAAAALEHLAVLRRALPDNPEVRLQWALALRQVGRSDEAKQALDDVLARDPNSAAALAERGTLALNAGDDRAAADDLAHAVRADPGSLAARNLLIQALTRLGRTDEVAREQARADASRGDADRMTELLNGPLQTRPNDPAPAAELAGIALRAGQPNAAINWYQLALKRDPRHAPSHTALAVIYREMGNPLLATRHRARATGGGR